MATRLSYMTKFAIILIEIFKGNNGRRKIGTGGMESQKIKLALYGLGYYGTFLKVAFDFVGPEDMEIVCYGTDEAQSESILNGLPIKSIEEIKTLYENGEIHAIILAVQHEKMGSTVSMLMLNGILDLYYLPYYEYDRTIEDFSFDLLQRVDELKPRLYYLEFHLADHCNLNCKGCSHLSNVVEPHLADYAIFERDIQRLRELFWGISHIRLLGGEPLLNPDLPRFIMAVRKAFPDTDMHVVSNGLLLSNQHTELLRTMHDAHCAFDISSYPPVRKIRDRIKTLCSLYGVNCLFTEPINHFGAMFDPRGEADAGNSYEQCPIKHCTYLKDGKISNCIVPFLLPEYGKIYQCELLASSDDIIDIYNPNINGLQILEHITRPIKACRFCRPENGRLFQWEIARKEDVTAEDWLAENVVWE